MYSRETELRHLQPNDVYKLGVILDDNNCWKKLMEIIPKELNAQASSADGALNWEQAVNAAGLKYNNDHIRLIEDAIKRSGESRLLSQILFEEWGTSGRRHERPTVGVLLQLLVKAELYRAADHVARHFLNEEPPEPPLDGPAARIDISLPNDIFNDIQDLVNDSSFCPGTETLNDIAVNGHSRADINKDFYSKYQRVDKNLTLTDENVAPTPPPRTQRNTRLLLQQEQRLQQQQQETHVRHEASTAEAINRSVSTNNTSHANTNENSPFTQNMPKLSALMTHSPETNSSTDTQQPNTLSTTLSEAPIPMISILTNSSDAHPTADASEILPVISALNINGDHDAAGPQVSESNRTPRTDNSSPQSSDGSHSSSISIEDNDDDLPDMLPSVHEEDDNDDNDEDNSVPNLSIFEQRSSNNDSSLTTVTGTSGDNSFEMSANDCSSGSNEENIPCLSALQQ